MPPRIAEQAVVCPEETLAVDGFVVTGERSEYARGRRSENLQHGPFAVHGTGVALRRKVTRDRPSPSLAIINGNTAF